MSKLSQFKLIANHYFEYGYAVVRGFLPMSDVSKISAESDSIIEKHWPQFDEKLSIKGTKTPTGVLSGDYIFSVNPAAFDENCKLKSSKRNAFYFVGWKLHEINDLFKRITFAEQNKTILKHLNFRTPILYQTGILHKVPGSDELELHQDEAFFNNESKGFGLNFWIAIDDSTEDNGCLVIYPGSHKTVKWRKVAMGEKNAYADIDTSKLIKVPANKGDMILLNSLLVHGSGKNRTNTLRRALAFSVYDKHRVKWSKDNFIQDGDSYKFVQLY